MKKYFILIFVLLFSSLLYGEKLSDELIAKRLEDFQKIKLNKKDFRGYDFFESKPLIVVGTMTKEDDEDEYIVNKDMAKLVKFRMEKWMGKSGQVGAIIADTSLEEKHLGRDLVLIGTPESNKIFKAIKDMLPIKIGDEVIEINDAVFEGDEIGASFVYPNPLNPKRMIWVVTSPVYESIRFVPKPKDYSIFQVADYNPKSDRIWELAEGDYNDYFQIEKVECVDNEEVDSGESDEISIEYELKNYPAPDWAKKGVMYEIFVRSFYDSDGDGIGDLRGIIEKLDYLNDGDDTTHDDLDIEVLWLMPILDSPSYHGYDVTDYKKINPDYGTNEDFQELLREAHKRGIRIVTDLILNHCSNQHPFYKDAYNNPSSKYDKWFFFTNQSNTRAHNWEFRHRETDRALLNPMMPAWNINNPEVRDYLFSTVKYWIDPNGDG